MTFTPFYQKEIFSNDDIYDYVKKEIMGEYLFRGKEIKRAPKREYFYPGHANKVYKWGQQKVNY